ncbi:hypothetical protein [Blastopirellula marina]|uniref:Carboxypeptidase regulatory-like domain-containing protein n=1 Tax=Blastopirellula marina TaxID=124 RepID=A0A2S8GK83_9BACT|nr:hypothetical protein [Blastopirellula marina]PQO44845.1 hypothetical protein C5Y93_17275 [Blastopirellula marina]
MRNLLVALSVAMAVVTFGCNSSSGPESYPISGTVLFGDKPVPAGSIMLTPDVSEGNSGMAVSIDIVDGKFNSNTAKSGHVGGPHIVKIVGLNGKGDDDLFPKGQMLFPDYEMSLDLPKEASEQELKVPGDLKMPKRSSKLPATS